MTGFCGFLKGYRSLTGLGLAWGGGGGGEFDRLGEIGKGSDRPHPWGVQARSGGLEAADFGRGRTKLVLQDFEEVLKWSDRFPALSKRFRHLLRCFTRPVL